MPNRTLSTRTEDAQIWERAEQRARYGRTSLSALVTAALVTHLGDTDIITVPIETDDGTQEKVAFIGRWIITPDPDGRWANGERVGIAETGRGRIAVYYPGWQLLDFDTIDDARTGLTERGDRLDPGVWTFVSEKLNPDLVTIRDI